MKLRFKSIKTELVVMSSVGIGILLVAILIFSLITLSKRTEENIEQGLKSTLELEVQKIKGFFEARGRVVETFLANPQLTDWFENYTERHRDITDDPDYKNITRMLDNLVKNDDPIKASFFASASTGEYFDNNGRYENQDYYATKRPWWGKAIAKNRLFVTPPEIDYNDKTVVSSIKQTVYDDKGTLIGIAGIDILLSTIQKEVKAKLKYKGQGDAFIIKNDGSIIFFPAEGKKAEEIKHLADVDSVMEDSDGFTELTKAMIAKQSGVQNVTWRGTKHFVGFEPISLEKPSVDWVAGLIVPESIKTEPIRKATLLAILGVIGILATLILIVRYVARRISTPLNRLVHAMKDISKGEGDLTIRLDTKSSNELGQLAHWFNQFIEKIQIVICDIAENGKTLNKSAHGLSNISGVMSEGVEKTSAKADEVSSASETMSQNMNSVAAAMEEATMNIGMVASATEEMTSTINEIAQNAENARSITNEAVSQSENASVQVSKLGTAAEEIGNVVETITEISQKVNLLALNATIEAARAGEAGRGFAVVANEIKDLAQQTAGATTEIEIKVKGIQSSTNSTVTEIEKISDVVNRVNEIVSTISAAIEEQSATTKEIASNVNNVSSGISDINENAAQSNTVASQIAQEIAEVTLAAEDISGRSREVNDSAEDLSKLSGSLNDIVSRFKIE